MATKSGNLTPSESERLVERALAATARVNKRIDVHLDRGETDVPKIVAAVMDQMSMRELQDFVWGGLMREAQMEIKRLKRRGAPSDRGTV